MIDPLLWWAQPLKAARAKAARPRHRNDLSSDSIDQSNQTMSKKNLDGVVTGASHGAGRGIAKALLRHRRQRPPAALACADARIAGAGASGARGPINDFPREATAMRSS